MQSPFKILFIDDHIGIREGVANLLQQNNREYEFLFAENSSSAIETLKENPETSLCILDLNLDGENGLAFLNALHAVNPELRTIVYSMYSDPIHIENALKAGVEGYITKNATIEELEKAIAVVKSGGNCYNKAATQIMRAMLSGNVASDSQEDVSLRKYKDYRMLTKTEQEIFKLLAEKKECDEISKLLGKKEKTVINQKSIIYQKLALRDRLDLIEYAKVIGVIL